MPRPTTMQEYLDRFKANELTSGYGILGVMQHMPCPFCAAAEFIVYRVLNVRDALARGATCNDCGRSAKALFTDSPPNGLSFEMVQTGGADQPEWLEPKMRRVDA